MSRGRCPVSSGAPSNLLMDITLALCLMQSKRLSRDSKRAVVMTSTSCTRNHQLSPYQYLLVAVILVQCKCLESVPGVEQSTGTIGEWWVVVSSSPPLQLRLSAAVPTEDADMTQRQCRYAPHKNCSCASEWVERVLLLLHSFACHQMRSLHLQNSV